MPREYGSLIIAVVLLALSSAFVMPASGMTHNPTAATVALTGGLVVLAMRLLKYGGLFQTPPAPPAA